MIAGYDWRKSEPRWQKKWKEWQLFIFNTRSQKPVYSIDTPPRYASGALHLGHAYGYTVIDFAARYRRLRGYNVFFPLCFDVNGTPVEVKVEKEFGIKASDVPRQEFIRMCSEFAEKNIAEMKHQFEILGESMDPSIYYQTDSKEYRKLTQISFLKMLDRNLVYKGNFPVNWCPRCETALADAEVVYGARETTLNYLIFNVEGSEKTVTIATTRPELLCTCQLVAVHPDDNEKNWLVGKTLRTPIYDRRVPVVADPKVDPSFGTGIVMICTIGDKDDLDWAMKYGLILEKGINERGRMTELAGKYEGLGTQEAKEAILRDIKERGLLVKQESLQQNVGRCWRCETPIEFLQVLQWFLRTTEFKGDVLQMVDMIQWFPEFMKVRLRDWVNSLAWDWVISRQRYFATPIPVWECEKCGEIVPAREKDCYVDPTIDKPPIKKCPKCGGPLRGETDVFDTWMDSSISPLYISYWLRNERMFKKLYPNSLRPQSHDIIRTWAYYTIVRELLLTNERPWEHIMIHGFILAPDGTPMHTSAGNVIDPIPFLERYGGDAMRYYSATCALGMDHAFKEQELVRGSRLCGKIWNIMRYAGGVCGDKSIRKTRQLRTVDRWILSRFYHLVEEVEKHCDNYEFDKAMSTCENFLWHEFADHYIELSKWRAYNRSDPAVRYTLSTIALGTLKMISIFLPHVAEDAYQSFLKAHDRALSICISVWPKRELPDEMAERAGEKIKNIVASVRAWKSKNGLPLNSPIDFIEIVGAEARTLSKDRLDIKETLRARSIRLKEVAKLRTRMRGVKPIYSKIGPAFRSGTEAVLESLKDISPEVFSKRFKKGRLELILPDGKRIELGQEFFEIEEEIISSGRTVDALIVGDMKILLPRIDAKS